MHNVKRFHLSEEAKRHKRLKEANQIKTYRTLNDSVLNKKLNKIFTDESFKQTTTLLDLNPEFYTIWNYRRDIITNHILPNKPKDEVIKIFNNELLFILAKLQTFPKVYWIWNHRVWILENHPESNYEYELKIVDKLLTSDSRNFHGWHYRRFVISKLESITGQSLALKEFEFTTLKINKDFSNFSAWHNRTKLLPILFQLKPTSQFDSIQKFLLEELEYLKNAMYTDPDDQSVWIYLRWLLTSDLFVKNIDEDVYLKILQTELQNVKELNELELEDNGKANNWCLKTIVTIDSLILKLTKENDDSQNEIQSSLIKLIDADPLRTNMYKYLSQSN